MISTFSCLTLTSCVYEYYATQRDAKRAPPPEDLVDIGGCKLHIHCEGAARPNTPTILIEAGFWDCSESWRQVQSTLAKSGLAVCTYDRAGLGWSEESPRPRTFEQMAVELKTGLEKKGVHPPFILIGHSVGGPIARYYRDKYPNDVVGIIFVDALHKKAPELPRIFKVITKAFYFLSLIAPIRPLLRLCFTAQQIRPSALRTLMAEWEGQKESFEALKAHERPLCNITLISRDPSKPMGPGMDAVDLIRQHLEESPDAKVVLAERSSHLVNFDRPDVIVSAVEEMVQ